MGSHKKIARYKELDRQRRRRQKRLKLRRKGINASSEKPTGKKT
ncbi:MAG: hypothetical protein ABSB79_08675 [Syntrophales bacterium]|jgi:hypothetical protein